MIGKLRIDGNGKGIEMKKKFAIYFFSKTVFHCIIIVIIIRLSYFITI